MPRIRPLSPRSLRSFLISLGQHVIRADLSYQHPIRTQTHACVDDLRIGNLGYIGTAFTLLEAHLPLIERIETEDRSPQ